MKNIVYHIFFISMNGPVTHPNFRNHCTIILCDGPNMVRYHGHLRVEIKNSLSCSLFHLIIMEHFFSPICNCPHHSMSYIQNLLFIYGNCVNFCQAFKFCGFFLLFYFILFLFSNYIGIWCVNSDQNKEVVFCRTYVGLKQLGT